MNLQPLLTVVVVVVLTTVAGTGRAANIRVLPEAEWSSTITMDVPGPTEENCTKERGHFTLTFSSKRGAIRQCTISSRDCTQKPGWQVVERDLVLTGSGRVQSCHQTGNH
jgi:hypothetical protein